MERLINKLTSEIEQSRSRFIQSVNGLNTEQVRFKISAQEWSILEITEHITWAEQIGICGMFRAIEGLKNRKPIWEGISPNTGKNIEQIIAETWKTKEKVPKVAEPRWGGSIDYWIASLKNGKHLLEGLIDQADRIDLKKAIYPHPISGPMNVLQRLDFLRFHLDRHQEQVERVKKHEKFPIDQFKSIKVK